MTSEEIERMIAKGEASLRREALTLPSLSWSVSSITMLVGVASVSLEILSFSLFLTFISLLVSLGHRAQFQEIETRRAELIWCYLSAEVFIRVNDANAKLVEEIANLYSYDPRGEILPLSPAIRLVETHRKQQQRLDIITARLGELSSLGIALQQKTQQLRALGESHSQGEARLQTLSDDEAALQTMRDQTEASCRRLELILIEARKAGQMRQLHREISALTDQKTRHKADSLALTSDPTSESLFDIEREISREVETWLQLERETDRHLREV